MHHFPFRVRYGDTDQMGFAYYANYLRWFEVGRAEMLRSLGTSYRDVEAEGIALPVVEARCRYLKPARYDDLLAIETGVRRRPRLGALRLPRGAQKQTASCSRSGTPSTVFSIATAVPRGRPPHLPHCSKRRRAPRAIRAESERPRRSAASAMRGGERRRRVAAPVEVREQSVAPLAVGEERLVAPGERPVLQPARGQGGEAVEIGGVIREALLGVVTRRKRGDEELPVGPRAAAVPCR